MEKILEAIKTEPIFKYAPILFLGIFVSLFLMGYLTKKIIDKDNEKDYTNLIDFTRIFYFVCASIYFYLVKQYHMILIFFGTDILANLILKRFQTKRMDRLREERNFWIDLKVEEAIKELKNLKE